MAKNSMSDSSKKPKASLIARAKDFFKGLRAEMRRVSFLPKRTVFYRALLVIGITAVCAIIIAVLDVFIRTGMVAIGNIM